MLAVDLLDGIDQGLAAKFEAIAPGAAVGTPEAKAAMDQVMDGLDYDSSDGTPADTVGGKSLDLGVGGRSALLKAKLAVNGVDQSEIGGITQGHFINVIKGMDLPGDTLGAKIKAFRAEYPGQS